MGLGELRMQNLEIRDVSLNNTPDPFIYPPLCQP
jgi:hypothetical protein